MDSWTTATSDSHCGDVMTSDRACLGDSDPDPIPLLPDWPDGDRQAPDSADTEDGDDEWNDDLDDDVDADEEDAEE